MKKVIYIVIRYSVLIEDSTSWNISKNSNQEYREMLFNKQRLEQHFELFKNITFPSIVNQTRNLNDIDFKLMLVTSEDLPDWNRVLLEEVLSEYTWAKICYLPSKGVDVTQPIYDDLDKYKGKVLFATIRLDDDDALAVDFIEKLEGFFIESNSGCAISFGLGLYGFYSFEKHQYYKFIQYYYPKIAAGLCYVNTYKEGKFGHKIKTIFQAGNHSKIDSNIPVIVYCKDIMFIRTMYDSSDSHSSNREKKLLSLPSLDPTIVENRFVIKSFDKEMYFDSSNISVVKNLPKVDRTRYNKRFDLGEGERLYNYIYKNTVLNFYANFKPKSRKILIFLPNQNDKEEINYKIFEGFEGTVIQFINLGISATSDITYDSIENKKYTDMVLILKEMILELIDSNQFSEENITFLGYLEGASVSLTLTNYFLESKFIVVTPLISLDRLLIEGNNERQNKKSLDLDLAQIASNNEGNSFERDDKFNLSIRARKKAIFYYQNVVEKDFTNVCLNTLLRQVDDSIYQISDNLTLPINSEKLLNIINIREKDYSKNILESRAILDQINS